MTAAKFDPQRALDHLARGARSDRLIHTQVVPAREAQLAAWPAWVPAPLYAMWAGTGIEALWSHQRAVADLAWRGRHVVCATGTASGKSLGYLVPVLSALHNGLDSPTGRGATALYLSPTKALAGDQEANLRALGLPGIRVATYDGDTPTDERRWIREHAHYVLTNPDLLHYSLLPGHERWAPFLRKLKFIVVDECHIYRGVFGTHVSAVLRRLMRVAARYGATPTVVMASATVVDPAAHAARVLGQPVQAVTDDGSPRETATFGLWEPPLNDDGVRRSAVAETADLLADLVSQDVQTVAFARSRVGVEIVADRARGTLASSDPDRAGKIAGYRGGYLPEDRRKLEAALRSGELLGMSATTALELGIDIAGLDAVILAGWPGTLASFWQQAGRAGRSGEASLAILVAGDNPLDRYMLHHPERVFERPVEASVFDPENPFILTPHLAAAAAELPLTEHDTRWFGERVPELAEALVSGGVLRKRPGGWFWARRDRAVDHVALRSAGEPVQIVETRTGRILGTVDGARAHSTVHTGAVYLHQGESFVITDLSLEGSTAMAVPGDPGWSTQAQSTSTFAILGSDAATTWGSATISWGRVEVTNHVTSFLRRLPSGEVIGEHPLDLPATTLKTQAVWWTLSEAELALAGVGEADIPGALHAAEHASIALLPLLSTSDRWDIGGVSTALHPDTGMPTVMIYDGYAGGAGIAKRGFEVMATWVTATRDAITDCPCSAGCPSCVQSPKCGNGNEPLDKGRATAVLSHLLDGAPDPDILR